MPGARCTRSLVCKGRKHTSSHHRLTGSVRLSLRNGFTAYFVLSPVTGLSCHRHLVGQIPRNLTPASGRQDHTTSPSAPAPLVLRHHRVHRIPCPTSVTIMIRPSVWDGMAEF